MCLLGVILQAGEVVLVSGETVSGDVVRMGRSGVTVRSAGGVATYQLDELDPEWVRAHVDDFADLREMRQSAPPEGGEITSVVNVGKVLLSEESLTEWAPWLVAHQRGVSWVAGFCAVLALLNIFFGWHLFRIWATVSGAVSGFACGIALVGVAGLFVVPLMEGVAEPARWIVGVVLIAAGLLLGWKLGHFFGKHAMFFKRWSSLGGIGDGLVGTGLSVFRLMWFDFSVILGQALFGAVLLTVGGYMAAVVVFGYEDGGLQRMLIVALALSVVIAVPGVMLQVSGRRKALQR